MKNRDTLLIVDGHNLLFQMFFGMSNRIQNKEGKAIEGVIGFVGALIKIMKQTNPTHVVIVFDGEHENSRTELLPEYKDNRIDYSLVPEEENPFVQLPDVYRALEYMGIPFYETIDVEADDVIASYALTFGKELPIVISSWDSDYFQLIHENVEVLRYRGTCTLVCDEKYIKEKFQIIPSQYADFKSLVGDRADNIRGAEKIGPKTAAVLLHQYESLDGLLAHAKEIGKKHIQDSLIRNEERLRINYQLIKLDNHAELPFSLEELKCENLEFKTNEVLRAIGLL